MIWIYAGSALLGILAFVGGRWYERSRAKYTTLEYRSMIDQLSVRDSSSQDERDALVLVLKLLDALALDIGNGSRMRAYIPSNPHIPKIPKPEAGV
jgi:hypothetical protein